MHPEPAPIHSSSRTSIVTGGTGAIGSAVVRLLAARGDRVVFTYRSAAGAAAALTREVTTVGGQCGAMPVDLTKADDVGAFVRAVADRSGAIDVVVHAAGPHVRQVNMSSVTPKEFRAQLDGESGAFWNLVHPAIPHLRASQGAIVAITTVALRRFPMRDGLSPTTKAGIEALVRVVAAEEGRYGIRANCVGPGILADGMAARLIASGEFDEVSQEAARRSIPLRRFGTAEDVARVAVFLASEGAAYVTGQSIDVDGGYSR